MQGRVNGLVLAGGGARGSYQVGAYQALQELGWYPGVITGTSVGCLNGALFTQGSWEGARDMWLAIDDDEVMRLPESHHPRELAEFLADVVRNGGLDVAPLEQLVELMLSETRIRTSPIKFGLVTVNLTDRRPLELPLSEIPAGRVSDYLLASASFFPGFKPRDIDGKAFIDGGYTDNMPTGLAARLGATNLVCVDVDGVGIQRPNTTGLPTTVISSHWELGPLMRFSPRQARYNMDLGYWDTYRTFGRLLGTAYAIRRTEGPALAMRFVAPYQLRLARVIRSNPALMLTERLAVDLFKPRQNPELAPLELACEQAGVDPTQIYGAKELIDAFLKAYDPQRAERFGVLLDADPPLALREAAIAAAQPSEFVTALVWRVLTGPLPRKTELPDRPKLGRL